MRRRKDRRRSWFGFVASGGLARQQSDQLVREFAVSLLQFAIVAVQRVRAGQLLELGDSTQQIVGRHVKRVRQEKQVVE